MKRQIAISILWFSLGAGAGVLSALQRGSRIYHVQEWGNDKNEGSEKMPWRSIRHAVHRIRPYDQVIVHKGNYVEEAFILTVVRSVDADK